MRERIARNQWWLLLLAGLLVGGGVWWKTGNPIFSTAAVAALFFLIMVKWATTPLAAYIIAAFGVLGALLTHDPQNLRLTLAGALGGAIVGLLLLLGLGRLKQQSLSEAPGQAATEEAPTEGLGVRTIVEGVPLLHTILGGPLGEEFLKACDEDETEYVKRAALNPLGYPTTKQVEEAKGTKEAEKGEKPPIKLFHET